MNIGAFVKTLTSDNFASNVAFILYFDGKQLDGLVGTKALNNQFQQLSSRQNYVVTGQDSHTISIEVSTDSYKGETFAIDDIYIIPVSGPDNLPVCGGAPASPEPACYATQSNYVKNPGFVYQPEFDTSMGYWRLEQQGPAWSDSSWVWNTAGRYDANGFQGSTYSSASGNVTSKLAIIQDNIVLPVGTLVDVKVDFNQQRKAATPSEPFSAVLRFDGTVMATYSAANDRATGRWQTLGNGQNNRPAITSEGPHSIALEVTTGNVAGKIIFWADNFSVTVVRAPNNMRICVG